MEIDSTAMTEVQAETSGEASEGANFTIDKSAFTSIKEGKAEILFPSSHDVFYNPVQEFNRDISIAVIREYAKDFLMSSLDKKLSDDKEPHIAPEPGKIHIVDGITILEALAASGLRSVRYAKEIPGVKSIIANDASTQAVESISRNIKYNKVEHIVTANEDDAALYMYKHRKYSERFNVVDIDPYGSPTMFLDAAVQAVQDGGLLLVTCTDMAVLCGNSSEKCYSAYGAISLKSKNCHEMAIRIVLQCIEAHANRYGRHIVPLLSLHVDFYLRIFVKVFTSPIQVKQTPSKLALVFQCFGCESFSLQPLGRCTSSNDERKKQHLKYSPAIGPVVGSNCPHCNYRYQLGGPIWADRLHCPEFVKKVLDSLESSPDDFATSKRIQGMLTLVLEELPDVPLFYSVDKLSNVMHTICAKSVVIRSAVLNAGYKVSHSHVRDTSVKTDAPAEFIWDVMRHWAKLHPSIRSVSDHSPCKVITSTEPCHDVSFEINPGAIPESRKKHLLRFQQNPEKFWGPKMRAKTSFLSGTEHDKKIRLQGKRLGKRSRPDNDTKPVRVDLKSLPCKRFKSGKCDRGENCKYSHNSVEQVIAVPTTSEENGEYAHNSDEQVIAIPTTSEENGK